MRRKHVTKDLVELVELKTLDLEVLVVELFGFLQLEQ
jgi:hypothetical protein